MITTQDAIRTARSMLGTPYSQLDCINFIKKIIREAPGGDPSYTDAHVPALWASYEASGKYKHLVWRQESLIGPVAGMLAFKGKPIGRDHQPSHVGLVTGPNTVIHSSSALGQVVETELNNQWTLLGQSRFITVGDTMVPEDPEGDETMESYQAEVVAQFGSTVNLRSGPSLKNTTIIKKVPVGTQVTVLSEHGEFSFVKYEAASGYMMSSFLLPVTEEPDTDPAYDWMEDVILISDSGAQIVLKGKWRLAED